MWPLWGRLRQRLHAQPIEEYHHQLDKKKIRCTSSDSKANFHSCRLLIWPFWWARKHKYTLASSMVDDRVPLDLDGRLWPKKKNELTLTRDDRLQHARWLRLSWVYANWEISFHVDAKIDLGFFFFYRSPKLSSIVEPSKWKKEDTDTGTQLI